MRLRHVLFAAASPLCLLASAAQAETVISTSITTPVATATAANGARDDIKVSSAGVVQPTRGTAITLNSNNNVTNEGAIKRKFLLGVGFGVRVDFDDTASLRFDYGFPVGNPSTDKNRPQVHISITAGF